MLFAVYTSEPQKPGQPKPHAVTIAALTGALAERGMSIHDRLLVGGKTVSQYDGDPRDNIILLGEERVLVIQEHADGRCWCGEIWC